EEKSIWTRLGLSAALALCMVVAGCNTRTSDRSIGYLGVGELSKWLSKSPEKYLLVDARGADEFAAGHIPGARRMSLPDIDERNPDPMLSRYSAVIVYGADPGSDVARAMTKRLLKARVSDVYLLEGGMAAWRSSGGPVVTG